VKHLEAKKHATIECEGQDFKKGTVGLRRFRRGNWFAKTNKAEL
jgi:hypothetical protein